jgi:uncharacterized protein
MNRYLRRPTRRVFVFTVVSIAIIAIYALISLQGYNVLSLLGRHHLTATPAGRYEDVSFHPRNQRYLVYAFFLPAEKTSLQALISVHGYGGDRRDEYHLKRAQYLRDLGYNVLAIDLSDNGGDTVGDGRASMGYAERWDVLGAYDYLLSKGFQADRIGLVGESLGAATSLLAGELEPHIRAIWADSAFTRADTVISEQTENSGFPRIVVPGGLVWGWLLSGDRLWEADPIDAGPAFAANKQAIYLIHCEPDRRVLFHHGVDLKAAYQAAGVDVTFWDVPDGGHTSAIINHRDEYLQRLDAFFKKHLA